MQGVSRGSRRPLVPPRSAQKKFCPFLWNPSPSPHNPSPHTTQVAKTLRQPTHSKFASIWWGLPAVCTSISGRAYDQLSWLRTLTQPCEKLGPSVRLTDLMDRPVDTAYESVGFRTILKRSSMSRCWARSTPSAGPSKWTTTPWQLWPAHYHGDQREIANWTLNIAYPFKPKFNLQLNIGSAGVPVLAGSLVQPHCALPLPASWQVSASAKSSHMQSTQMHRKFKNWATNRYEFAISPNI